VVGFLGVVVPAQSAQLLLFALDVPDPGQCRGCWLRGPLRTRRGGFGGWLIDGKVTQQTRRSVPNVPM
jgi:hypothetical protein